MTAPLRVAVAGAGIGSRHVELPERHEVGILADASTSLDFPTAAHRSSRTGVAKTLPIGPDHPACAGWRPE